jgi:hypothetical protein
MASHGLGFVARMAASLAANCSRAGAKKGGMLVRLHEHAAFQYGT